jgi:hypothetical protein
MDYIENTASTSSSVDIYVFVAKGTCLPCCLATAIYFGYYIPAFSSYWNGGDTQTYIQQGDFMSLLLLF